MIEISGLCKNFGERTLFKDFDAVINTGEFVVFSGESGCGKSTLLNMIGAIEPYDKGSISIDGIDVGRTKNHTKLFREVYGFVFQNFALAENKTVGENLSFVLQKYSTEISVTEALERVGLAGFEKKPVYKLSGGEQQRVALARLLRKKCSIILADEPTGSLDKRNADEIMDILLTLKNQGKTIVLVTHNNELKRKGDRLIELHKLW